MWNKEKGSWLIVRAIEATLGPATDKHQAPTHRLKLYVRAVIESEAWPTIKEETIAINRDWALI